MNAYRIDRNLPYRPRILPRSERMAQSDGPVNWRVGASWPIGRQRAGRCGGPLLRLRAIGSLGSGGRCATLAAGQCQADTWIVRGIVRWVYCR
jgi:hypothetical protein